MSGSRHDELAPQGWRLGIGGVFALVALGLVAGVATLVPPSVAHAESPSSTAPGPLSLSLVPFTDGLDAPVFITGDGTGSGSLYAVERPGRIRAIASSGGLAPQPFLDITDRLVSGGEQGLLGLAFHPGYATNGRLFVDYTRAQDGATVISEFHASGGLAPAGSERILLVIPQPFPNHNGGMLAFDMAGRLLIGMGDGGSGGDPQGNGQDRQVLLGKLLRIDVDRRSSGKQYAVPKTNPFRTRAGWRPEIYALGLRNPWRFSFDSKKGDLWIGDVGQDQWEEIDHVGEGRGRGANFGWNRLEGTHRFSSGSFSGGRLQGPVAQYRHGDAGCSVTGGYVYRGPSIVGLNGRYVFADYCSGQVWSLSRSGGAPRAEIKSADVTSFGEDSGHRLYLCSDGAVYRFDPASG